MAATRVQGQRDMGLSVLNLRGLAINDASNNTNSVTVYASDSGIMFINKNTTLNTNYVLPAVADADGKMFWFLNATPNGGYRITAPTNTLVANNTAIKNYAATGANTVGIGAIVVGDGSKYYLFELGSIAFTLG